MNAIKKTAEKSVTWVVVTDGGKALFFVNHGGKLAPCLELGDELSLDNPRTRDQGTDRPGRYNDSMGRKSSVEETDWHRLAKAQFAEAIADKLNSAALSGAFQSLILFADAVTLGELRKRFHKEVNLRIVFEEALDLTKHPVADIERRVKDAFLPSE
jgi:protein required for attachment to host cells